MTGNNNTNSEITRDIHENAILIFFIIVRFKEGYFSRVIIIAYNGQFCRNNKKTHCTHCKKKNVYINDK